MDAVHKCSDGDGGGGGEEGGGGGGLSSAPKIEEITDTMIFSPADLVTMTCRDVDLNFAVRGKQTQRGRGTQSSVSAHQEKLKLMLNLNFTERSADNTPCLLSTRYSTM